MIKRNLRKKNFKDTPYVYVRAQAGIALTTLKAETTPLGHATRPRKHFYGNLFTVYVYKRSRKEVREVFKTKFQS
jgi:hypothetical protein